MNTATNASELQHQLPRRYGQTKAGIKTQFSNNHPGEHKRVRASIIRTRKSNRNRGKTLL